ncbi:MAG TPA: serine hydrolase domain-containing protein [Thermoanaerobaculia bacterium]|nr:serine hydrolase domain-containing protein [Thermoanaerobaculia bacterium]
MTGTVERLPRTRQAIEEGIRWRLHLGAQVYVSLRGEAVADGALGENRPGEPLTGDHLMLWLSSTKPAGAVALAQLWERGLLELDDPVARHIPEFGAHGKERITLRHLLTHTAGIRMLDVGWPERSWEEIVAKICAMRPEPRWVPGEKAGYHTASSWFVLGEVIRRVDGRPFDRYVREEVFVPLGMHDSWVGMPAERYLFYKGAGRLGALWNTEGPEPKEHGWDTEERCVRPNPGGNGYGPVRELGRFYETLLARGMREGRRILSPQAVEALTARHRVGMMDATFKHVLDWGLGFIVSSAQYGTETVPYGYGHHASPRTFGHSGYRSSTGFADPERGLAVALAFNGTPGNEAHEQRVRSVLDAVYEDLGFAGGPSPQGEGPE